MTSINVLKMVGAAALCTDVYVFARWHYHPKVDRDPNDKSGNKPPVDPIKQAKHGKHMMDNWTISIRNLEEGRWWTLVSAAFSHIDLMHLGVSMFGLWQSYRIMRIIRVSPPRVIALGLGSAAASSAVYLWDMSTRPAPQCHSVACGASGALYGLFTGAMLAVPNMPMGVPFVPLTFTLRTLMLGATALDACLLYRERSEGKRQPHPLLGGDHGVAYSAHLGGAAFGTVFYALALRKYRGRVVSH